MTNSNVVSLALLALCAATPVHSLSLTVFTDTNFVTPLDDTRNNGSDFYADPDGSNVEDPSVSSFRSISSAGVTFARSSAEIDGAAGQIKMSTLGAAFGDSVGGSAAAGAAIYEVFTVSGTGTLTASMEIDGVIDVVDGADWAIEASVCILCFTLESVETSVLQGNQTNTTFDFNSGIFSASFDYTNAENALSILGWELTSTIGLGTSASLDLSNTANLNFFTTGDLVVTNINSSFLSSPVLTTSPHETAPVPIPATGFLLFFSICFLSLCRRFQS